MDDKLQTPLRVAPLVRARNLCFIVYFVLLLCERLAGGILGIFRGGEASMLGAETLIPRLVHPLALLALLAGIIVMRRQWLPLLRSVSGTALPLDCNALAGGIGCFLLSGMLHTGVVLLPVQFTSYGFLMVGLVLHAVYYAEAGSARRRGWAVAYLLSFSMTVPVVYDTALEGVRRGLFIGVELVTTFYLIFAFSMMTAYFLRTGRCGANPAVLILMLILTAAVFFLRLPEYTNFLLAIFPPLTLLIWICIFCIERSSIRFSLNPFDFTPPSV